MIIFNQSDEDLMAWVCIGQAGAFEELLRRYENKFFSIALRKTRNQASAEDITQETFAAIYERRDSFNRKFAKFFTWAYAILNNQIDKCLRDNEKPNDMISLSSVEDDRDDWLATARQNWFDDCTSARLQKLRDIVMQYLNEEEQALYHLKEELGLSYDEIKKQEPFKGLSADTLMKRRQRYKEKIIDAMEIEKYNFKCLPREVKNGKK